MSIPSLPHELAAFGWDDEWAASFAAHAPDGALPARVARVDRGACNAVGEASYRVQLLPRTEWPVTGDWIAVVPAGDGQKLDQLGAVLPRRKALRRLDADERRSQLVVANVDVVLAVMPLDRPVKPGLRDRLLVLAAEAHAEPVVVLSKADVADPDVLAALEADMTDEISRVPQLIVSALRGEGIEDVRAAIGSRRTAVMLGPSGAGKSTLANALLGQELQRTGEVREGDHKGRHTTTSRELMVLPGDGVLIDTPGVRAVGLWDAEEAIDEVFSDIAELAEQCRFSDCAHRTEPGCAIREAVDAGEIDPARVGRWRELLAEGEARERLRVEHERRAQGRAGERLLREELKRKGRR
jgi:ribosome biogenesis GTPase